MTQYILDDAATNLRLEYLKARRVTAVLETLLAISKHDDIEQRAINRQEMQDRVTKFEAEIVNIEAGREPTDDGIVKEEEI